MIRILRKIAFAAAIVTFASCQEKQEGNVSFFVVEGEVRVETKSSVSQFASLPEESDFALTVVQNNTGKSIFDGALSDWNPATRLAPGEYTAGVSAGDEGEEGFEKPFFTGSQTFRIQAGQKTDVGIKVSLGNCIVKLSCTQTFEDYFPQREFIISTPYNQDGFIYDGTPVFVNWQFSVGGTVTNQEGKTATLETKTWKGDPATCYTVVYDITNVGGVTVTISFDDEIQIVNLGTINLNS